MLNHFTYNMSFTVLMGFNLFNQHTNHFIIITYNCAGVNDVAEGGNDVYLDASEVEREIPVFGDDVLEGHCFVKKLKELLWNKNGN